jgi:hypothetical protein
VIISSQVRKTGEMRDFNGVLVEFGADHDCITVNGLVLPADDDEFTRHLSAALEAAKAHAGVECTGACCLGADHNPEEGNR